MGKNIGGALGAPFEWMRQVNDIDFYTEEHGGESIPNDDLDLQLLWLVALEEQGPSLCAAALAEYWCLFATPHWAEYGTAKTHLRSGLLPPLSGDYRNDYRHSCGAYIRAEIWAVIAAGNPALAAHYALEDASVDHGSGEGMYAEVFIAALEAAAFVEGDLQELIRIGLSYIPAECGVAGAVRCVVDAHAKGLSWREAREAILEDFRGSDALGSTLRTSPEDQAKGFHTGVRGWDAPSNVAITILGLLYGEGDFGKTLCTAVNCGEDTDCTAATAGSIFGILHGYEAIPQRWIEPIGHGIKTVTLNLADMCCGDHRGGIGKLGPFGTMIPSTVENLTERSIAQAKRVAHFHQLPVAFDDEASGPLAFEPPAPLMADAALFNELYWHATGPVHRFPSFEVGVDYNGEPVVRSDVPKTVTLTIRNRYRTQANLRLQWYAPESDGETAWKVAPGRSGHIFMHHIGFEGQDVQRLTFTLRCERLAQPQYRFVVELTVDGRPTVMHVPMLLLNGDLHPEQTEKDTES